MPTPKRTPQAPALRRRWMGRSIVAALLLAPLAVVAWALDRAWTAAAEIVHPARAVVDRSPSDFGLPYEDVVLRTADGLELRGWYIPPSEADGAVVMAESGYGSSRASVITHTALLSRHGYGVLTFDWRASGLSEGDTSTLGDREVLDVAAARDWLRWRPEVDQARVGALGQSAGGAAMLLAAADDPTISAVVAETTFSSLPDMVAMGLEHRTGLPAFPFAPLIVFFGERQSGVRVGSVRPVDSIGRIAPRPVMLIRAGQDETVPAFNADRLMEAAGEPKVLWDAPAAVHSRVLQAYPTEYEERVVGFFDRYLGHPVPGG